MPRIREKTLSNPAYLGASLFWGKEAQRPNGRAYEGSMLDYGGRRGLKDGNQKKQKRVGRIGGDKFSGNPDRREAQLL